MQEVRYEKPATVEAACALLAGTPGARILAGGTDLVVDLKFGVARPPLLVDLKAIPGIREIRWDEPQQGDLVIGAAVTMRQVYADARLCELYPGLAAGAEAVGSLQVRHRATVGGNLCNASPCMDTAPPLLVLDARVQVASAAGAREIPLAELFVDVKKTALAADELATAILVPAASRGRRTAFDKIKRVQGHDLALVNAAAAYDPNAGTLRAAVGSCGVTPVLTPTLEGIAPGADAAEVGGQLAASALEHACPIDDVRASAEYRREMIGLLCRRLVRRLLADEAREVSR